MITVTINDCARCRYARRIGGVYMCTYPDVCRGAK